MINHIFDLPLNLLLHNYESFGKFMLVVTKLFNFVVAIFGEVVSFMLLPALGKSLDGREDLALLVNCVLAVLSERVQHDDPLLLLRHEGLWFDLLPLLFFFDIIFINETCSLPVFILGMPELTLLPVLNLQPLHDFDFVLNCCL